MGARGLWGVVGTKPGSYQSMDCPQSLYRDLRRFALAFATSRGRRQRNAVLAGATPAHRHMVASARPLWPPMRAAYRRILHMVYCCCSSVNVSLLGVVDYLPQPQSARMLMQPRSRSGICACAKILLLLPKSRRSWMVQHDMGWLAQAAHLSLVCFAHSHMCGGGVSSAAVWISTQEK